MNEKINGNLFLNLLQQFLSSTSFLMFYFSGKIDLIKFTRVIQLSNPTKAMFQSFLNLD